jgi:hypothetical protein
VRPIRCGVHLGIDHVVLGRLVPESHELVLQRHKIDGIAIFSAVNQGDVLLSFLVPQQDASDRTVRRSGGYYECRTS